ncbi:MAG: 2,3-bisphosphoglycerate-independent phosphoglycerate mutase [bacterium]|nr:MAG: 2,3-bisphosphoglycerate-independent phosphoglycerate mutase [bacterium]
MNTDKIPPLVLCILDGWGKNDSEFGNAILASQTPNFDFLEKNFPPTHISASGEDVGLPEGQMGNSEVGHLNIGAGRVIMQDLPMINRAIKDGSFYENPVIHKGMMMALKNNVGYHLLGLVSDGGVHSHINHLEAILKKCRREGLKNVFIHAMTDGRDTAPHSGTEFIYRLLLSTLEIGVGKIATISGRYWGMDRDNRWDRLQKAYNAIVHGRGVATTDNPVGAIAESYNHQITDEFLDPTVVVDQDGAPSGLMREGDVVQFFNFRPDRIRQIVSALTEEDFNKFDRGHPPRLHLYCMTEYDPRFRLPAAFVHKPPEKGLGQLLSEFNISQFRTAETEKYAHVTYFLNGGIEARFPGETRCLIPSPKVATYDLKPEMNAGEVTNQAVNAITSGKAKMVVVNLANGDMVGHTGVFGAAIKAVETIDHCVGRMMEAVKKVGGNLIVTADHGNIEQMINSHHQPITAHSTNVVPFYIFGPKRFRLHNNGGALCDVAPTVLSLLEIKQPREMTGRSLILPV